MTKEPSADPLAEAKPLAPASTLKQAIRAARFDDAERVGVQAELRASQIGRLEMLHEALAPLLDQVPRDAEDLFDVGLMPGATPRLFIDMIGFVEMGRDSRLYRLLQDSRHARLTLAESTSVQTMVDAITHYVARRLLEREKALAADAAGEPAKPPPTDAASPEAPADEAEVSEETSPAEDAPAARPRRRRFRWLTAAFAFVIDLLGAIAFFALVAAGCWFLWSRLQGHG